jgi:uncharacterized membrane protein
VPLASEMAQVDALDSCMMAHSAAVDSACTSILWAFWERVWYACAVSAFESRARTKWQGAPST